MEKRKARRTSFCKLECISAGVPSKKRPQPAVTERERSQEKARLASSSTSRWDGREKMDEQSVSPVKTAFS
jgi:hypothetical protein